jgi:hypothetical protein
MEVTNDAIQIWVHERVFGGTDDARCEDYPDL